MNSFWKGWGLYINPWKINNSWNTGLPRDKDLYKTLYQQLITNQDSYFDNLQKQYAKFGWGNIHIDREKVLQKMDELPKPNCSYITTIDINRILKAQQIYNYHNQKDPARPRINKYL